MVSEGTLIALTRSHTACIVGSVENTTYGQAVPGDVLVLAAGDVRQLQSSSPTPQSAYVALLWVDGTTTIQERHGHTTRLHPSSATPKGWEAIE